MLFYSMDIGQTKTVLYNGQMHKLLYSVHINLRYYDKIWQFATGIIEGTGYIYNYLETERNWAF